ncbi:hypothetical protein [Hansschlegelia zhihuaiae]|uniref:Uncharacterized protein n=1 Tax=Hansschlegelia zhihuaiae TaxID=405005 RepID=A0A4Q0MIY3_9HYPH|nr:hypothetical protein [Hansschlegelia zhihuaiae]RXF73580.1 hypothetical protein EK403_10355 [Hansschlegelia zhihuaiae]
MTLDARRAAWNEVARSKLTASRDQIPGPVLVQALARRWTPKTARAAVDFYWRAHPLRADRLARALAAAGAPPPGWRWSAPEIRAGFRLPPQPFRSASPEPGRCVVCGQSVFRLGWHVDLWGAGVPNRRAAWHACCVAAWRFWTAPQGARKLIARVQKHKCALGGRRLLKGSEVDHRVPLHEVWRDRRDLPFAKLLGFWGAPNLQVVNAAAHAEKSAREATSRAALRAAAALEAPAS